MEFVTTSSFRKTPVFISFLRVSHCNTNCILIHTAALDFMMT